MTNRDEQMIAHHEAGHVVAMWKLGYGVERVSIEPEDGLEGFADSSYEYVEPPDADEDTRRFIVEDNTIFLHGGDVAARLLRPEVDMRQAVVDHDRIHERMSAVESDPTVRATWCTYLWQRAYELLTRPCTWPLVTGLAGQILLHRRLHGEDVDLYLTRAQERLRADPRTPNVVILSLTYRCSPWHRSWCEKSATSSPAPRASIVPASIVELSARRDRRPVLAALGPLSRRAARSLDRAGIRTVAELEDTSARALAAVKGCGRKTVEEIMLAVRRARIQMSA